MTAALTGGATGTVLGVATWLEPASAGIGTHEQLNLPTCGWIASMGMPCPTCGMTTAFAHAAEGDLLSSFHTQPAGATLAVLTAMTFLAALHVLVTGSGLLPALAARFWGPRTAWVAGGLVLLAWGWKIATHKGVF